MYWTSNCPTQGSYVTFPSIRKLHVNLKGLDVKQFTPHRPTFLGLYDLSSRIQAKRTNSFYDVTSFHLKKIR